MRKVYVFIVVLFSLFSIFYTLHIGVVHAAGEFDTDLNVTYQVNESGVTTVSQQVSLTNVLSEIYATSYSLILEGIDPQSVTAHADGGQVYTTNVTKSDKTTTIKIDFPDTVVGKGKTRNFWVNYVENSFAVRTGEVWEIFVPRLSAENDFNNYNIRLKIPKSLGDLAYISPTARQTLEEESFNIYTFYKDDVVKSGIVAGFGQFQVFSFNLNYHLENPLSSTSDTEISLPPDTAFQRMYYTNISPKPTHLYVDEDGNWIAKYSLKPRERVDVLASGAVQIFASQRPYLQPSEISIKNSLLEQPFWQINDAAIKQWAKEYNTPSKIYGFVTSKLKYNYDRVKPNVERLGAVQALQNPDQAICMEFTDLFIAISRAAGIPAREINGYAYTENPEIQPLSLVNDVLHSWPEYYDVNNKSWIPVDPTWGSTTGGVDFFNKLDLRHFTFVIHGKDSAKPYAAGSYKLGSNPQKDVFVSFGKLPDTRISTPEVNANFGKWVPFLNNKLLTEIQNPGPVALYNLKPKLFFDGAMVDSNMWVDVLLPYQTVKSSFEIPFSFLATKTPNQVLVVVEGQQVSVHTNKNQVIIYNLLFIFTITILLVLSLIVRLKKVSILAKLTSWRKKS